MRRTAPRPALRLLLLVGVSIVALASPATTRRGLYVAATRGRDTNTLCVVTDSDDSCSPARGK